MDLIREIFFDVDVYAILKLPVCSGVRISGDGKVKNMEIIL